MEFQLDQALAMLERTPSVVKSLLCDLSSEWTERDYGEKTWSAKQVLGHLIHGERTDWIARVNTILEKGDTQAFAPFDRSGHTELCNTTSLQDLMELFAKLRHDNLQTVRSLNLKAEDFDRPGKHPSLGAVTLRNLFATWAVHDLNHLAQICKAMAYQFKTSVGPWEAYLSVLAPPSPR